VSRTTIAVTADEGARNRTRLLRALEELSRLLGDGGYHVDGISSSPGMVTEADCRRVVLRVGDMHEDLAMPARRMLW
jgi:hypothetical protein